MAEFQNVKSEYADLWDGLELREARHAALGTAAGRIVSGKAQYEAVSELTGVPWYVIGILHNRESDCSFRTHLHNGDPLTARTFHKPAGRPKTGAAPFDWADSAVDALAIDKLNGDHEWSVEWITYSFEKYNGWGYRGVHAVNPYLWAGSTHYERGKFVRDGQFVSTAVDQQCGAMAILKTLIDLGEVSDIPRDGAPRTPAKATPAPFEPHKSRTIMGAVYAALGVVLLSIKDVIDLIPSVVNQTRQVQDPVDQLLSTVGVHVPHIGAICAAAGLMLVILARVNAHNEGKIG